MDPPPRPNTAQSEELTTSNDGPGSTFLERLATYFDDNEEANCKWDPHQANLPTPEDMAAAGFILAPSGTQHDNTVCNLCKLQCFQWEEKDDPYKEHAKANPDCAFVLSDVFARFRAKFRANRRSKARKSPTVLDDGPAPKAARRPRKKVTLTKIQTVADLEPVPVFVTPSKPMRIQISSGGINMDFTINGDDVMQTPTKKRRFN